MPAPFAAPRAAAPRPTSRPFPCRLSEPWRRCWRRSTALVMLVAMGGGALLSRLREEGGSGGVCEEGVAATSEGERTAPVSSAYKEGRGGRFVLPLKQPPTISPTMPHSTRAVMGECGGYGTRFGVAQPACARALFWAWATHGAERCWARPKSGHRHTRTGTHRILLRIHRALP